MGSNRTQRTTPRTVSNRVEIAEASFACWVGSVVWLVLSGYGAGITPSLGLDAGLNMAG